MKIDKTKPTTNAERQRAHRQRVKDRLAGLPPAPPPKAPKKPPLRSTRPKQLEAVASTLSSLLAEYEGWLESLPANLAESEKAEQLQDTIAHLQAALDELEAIDPPRVGR